MTRTDPRIIKTLRQIDNALLENLKERDFQKITIDMLCRSASINRSTFYKYYKDKTDLLDQYLERVLGEFRTALSTTEFVLAAPDDVGGQQYQDTFRRSMDFIFANRNTYMILWNAKIGRKIYDEMVFIVCNNILSMLWKENSPAPEKERYQRLYAQIFASNMMMTMFWWFENADTVTADEVGQIMSQNTEFGPFATFKKYL